MPCATYRDCVSLLRAIDDDLLVKPTLQQTVLMLSIRSGGSPSDACLMLLFAVLGIQLQLRLSATKAFPQKVRKAS